MAEQIGYVLNERQVDRIRRALRWVEGQYAILPDKRKRAIYDRDYTRIPFVNDYAGTIPAYGVLRVTELVESDGVKIFEANRPDTSFNRLYLVNGPEDVAEDGFGWGTWLWHADEVLYDDANTPAMGESWGPQNASFELAKWRYGFTIWGLPTGGTTDRVMASQEWVNQFLCKSNEEFTANGDTGAVSVYDGNGADTSIDVSGCVNRTGLVWDSGTWGKATWLGGKWYVEMWECPA